MKLRIRLEAAENKRLAAENLCRKLVEELEVALGNKRSNFDITGINETHGEQRVWVTTLTWYAGGSRRYSVLALFANPSEGVVYLKTWLDKPKYTRLAGITTDQCLDIIADAVIAFIKSRPLHMTPKVIGDYE